MKHLRRLILCATTFSSAALLLSCMPAGSQPPVAESDPKIENAGRRTPQESEASAPAGFDQTHATFTRILSEHVEGDRLDYAALRAERAPLDAYIGELEAVDAAGFTSWSEPERFAFWDERVQRLHVARHRRPLSARVDSRHPG